MTHLEDWDISPYLGDSQIIQEAKYSALPLVLAKSFQPVFWDGTYICTD